MRYLIIFVLASIPLCALGSFCETLEAPLSPLHDDGPPMPMSSSFVVTSVSTAHQSEILTVRIKSVLSELNFGGFIVHARTTSPPYEILGRFTSSIIGLNLLNCDGEDNIATYYAHPEGEGRDEVELQWQAPSGFVGEIVFKARIAQDVDKFWVGVTSTPVEILQDDVVTSLSTRILSAMRLSNISNELPLVKAEEQLTDSIYVGCGSTKTCFGTPNNCVAQQSCLGVATAVVVENRYEFELKSSADQVAYVALGLSRNALMGNDSVMECVHENGVVRAYSSWNYRRTNSRVDVPQGIVRLINSSSVDGTIYCKLERDAATTVRETEFNLVNDTFHFSVAVGRGFTSDAIQIHNIGRLSSEEPLEIIGGRVDDPSDPIYEGCGTNKICLGLPADCVEQQSCRAIVAVTVVESRYKFEMRSGVAGVRYVSFALSKDEFMGDDSVVECVVNGNAIAAYASWNQGITNTRVGVQQNIITLLNSSFVDGTIYCEVERETSTVVLGKSFDLRYQDFYFLLAIGDEAPATSISYHNLGRVASTEAFVLPGRGSGHNAVKISAISIAIWFLVTSCTHFYREV